METFLQGIRKNRAIFFLFLSLLAIKFAVMNFLPNPQPCGEDCRDAKIYHHTGELPTVVKSPAYTLLAVGIHKAFGYRSPASEFFMRFAQILSSFVAFLGVFLLAQTLWGNRVAGIAATLLFFLEPLSFIFTYNLHTEMFFIGFFTFFLFFIVRFLKKGGTRNLFWGSVLLAASAAIRPVAYYLFVPVLIGLTAYLLISRPKTETPWKLLAFVLPFTLLVGSWQARNWIVSGSPEFTMIKAYNLLNYRASLTLVQRDGVSLEEARQSLYSQLPPLKSKIDSNPETLRAVESLAWEVIRANPVSYFKAHLKGTLKMLFGPGFMYFSGFFGHDLELIPWQAQQKGRYFSRYLDLSPKFSSVVWTQYYAIFFLGALYLLVAIGLIRSLQSANAFWPHAFLVGVVLYFIAASGPEAYSRFRIPLLPIFTLYGGLGFSVVYHYFFKKHERTQSLPPHRKQVANA